MGCVCTAKNAGLQCAVLVGRAMHCIGSADQFLLAMAAGGHGAMAQAGVRKEEHEEAHHSKSEWCILRGRSQAWRRVSILEDGGLRLLIKQAAQ